ncbi:hypothetical protein QR685DRAFT_528644 [Neurospora intermedia]|uniref:Uncharacterized protein n=1 Tax=Neurospora intermedia TaxID=5142 RepID=A0ABR3D7S8_NEUIN
MLSYHMFHTWGLYDAMNPTIPPVRTMHHFLLSSVITRPLDCTRISFGRNQAAALHDCNCNKRHASDLYVQRYRTSTFHDMSGNKDCARPARR